GGRGLGGDLAPLGVHAVLGDVLDLHGQEGAGADVQSDARGGDAAGGELGEQDLVEVERGGGGGDRSGAGGEDGLVVGAVGGVGRAAGGDVGGQRHLAGRLERPGERRGVAVEVEQHLGPLPVEQAGGEAGAEVEAVAGGEAASGPGKRPP